MSTITTIITRRGQVTIPKSYRDALQLEEGDVVRWDLTDGKLVLQRIGSVADATFAVVPPRRTPEDFEDLRKMYQMHRANQIVDVLESAPDAEAGR